MGRIARLIWIDEIIWTQFQALYPRQASRIIEDNFRSLINMKLDITDEAGEQLKQEKDQLQARYDELYQEIKERELKIRAWESKKHKEILKDQKEYDQKLKEAEARTQAIKNSGLLWRK